MSVLTAGLGVSGLGGVAFAANAVGGGPDLVGIAAVITSVAGLIGVIGTFWRRDQQTREDIRRAVRDGIKDGIKRKDRDDEA